MSFQDRRITKRNSPYTSESRVVNYSGPLIYPTAKNIRITRLKLYEAMLQCDANEAAKQATYLAHLCVEYLWKNHQRVMPRY